MTAHPAIQRSPARLCMLALSGWAVLLWGGCVTRGQLDTLEAELRQQQDAVQMARRQSNTLQSELARARQETELLRSQMAAAGQGVPLPEQTGNLVRLSEVKINTLLSGGKDRDGQPGDDLLVALISPLDEQGDLVKIAGEVEIEAFDMTLPNDDKRVGHWTFDAEQSSKAWHSGFVGAGLQFELPWQEAPTSKELLVHVRLKTTDGRQFDSSTPLKIAPPAGLTAGRAVHSRTEPVKFEAPPPGDEQIKPALDATAEPRPVRPVPFYDDVEPVETTLPFPGDDKKTDAKAMPEAAPAKRPAAPISAPEPPKKPGRASLDEIETSDNWTDATLPRLR